MDDWGNVGAASFLCSTVIDNSAESLSLPSDIYTVHITFVGTLLMSKSYTVLN